MKGTANQKDFEKRHKRRKSSAPSSTMGKEKKQKKERKEKKESKKTKQNDRGDTEENASGTTVKSIADLFNNTSTDPTLEALFKTPAGPLKPLRRAVPLIKPQEDDKLIPDGNIKNSIENDADVRGEDDIQQEDLAINAKQSKKRKRKEREEEAKTDDLESRYITKVYSQILKKQKADPVNRQPEQPSLPVVEPEDDADNDETIDPELLQHETVDSNSTSADQTIFISNLPVKVLTSKPHLRSLKQLFATYGPITSIRFRSIAFTDLVPRKQAFITKKLHPERDTLNAYLVYQTKDSVTPAVNALNGYLWEEKHLRVDSVSNPTPHDHKRSVFVGNLPFDVQDEAIYTHFARCGKIEFVRIVRDKKTNIGKGFGYVQFKDREAVDKAVLLNDKPADTIKRALRVTYAKREDKRDVKRNVVAARTRVGNKEKKGGIGKGKGIVKNTSAVGKTGGKREGVLEGKRAARDKSGGSGFKMEKKRGKMRLVETKS